MYKQKVGSAINRLPVSGCVDIPTADGEIPAIVGSAVSQQIPNPGHNVTG